jgi:hypothetical protein|tara:strand:+ start:146 stop:556 length:411 start_codon:yes stop_codon:yes gene_type:complete
MKKLKKFDLLRVKEQLNRQKSVSELNRVELDSLKCENISLALSEILEENHNQTAKVGVNAFISNRHLIHKMMDQREVISNRLEFLEREKSSLLLELGKSKAKDEILERKKIKIKRQAKEDSLRKNDENIASSKPSR